MSTQKVADFIATISFSNLPANVIAKAKLAIRDALGAALAAHKDKAVEATRRVARVMGGKEESTLIGVGVKVPSNLASWVNAVMASTIDIDDGCMGTEGHLCHGGGVIVPSSLAVAEAQNSTGKELIEAVVVGYEVALRTAGMLSTISVSGKPGPYGAAAAAAKLLKLGTKETMNALGIAEAHRPDPPLDPIWERPAMTKEAMGWAAMTGVTAALLAQAGFAGPRMIYDLPEFDKTPLETLGKEWLILDVYFKPYAMCRCGHTTLDGLLELVKENNLKADDISKITVGVASTATLMINFPSATVWEAQYSIPFAVGAALMGGELSPEQMAESKLGDEAVLTQCRKVELVTDPEADALWPRSFSSRVQIEMKDGRKFEVFKRYPKGDTQNPISEEEVREKFKRLVVTTIGADRTEDLSKCLDKLEDCGVSELIEKISR